MSTEKGYIPRPPPKQSGSAKHPHPPPPSREPVRSEPASARTPRFESAASSRMSNEPRPYGRKYEAAPSATSSARTTARALRLGLDLDKALSEVGVTTFQDLKKLLLRQHGMSAVADRLGERDQHHGSKPSPRTDSARAKGSSRPPSSRSRAAAKDREKNESSAGKNALRPSIALERFGHLMSAADRQYLLSDAMTSKMVYYLGVDVHHSESEPHPDGYRPESGRKPNGKETRSGSRRSHSPQYPGLRSHIGFRYELVARMDLPSGWYGRLFLGYDYALERQVAIALRFLDSGVSRASAAGTKSTSPTSPPLTPDSSEPPKDEVEALADEAGKANTARAKVAVPPKEVLVFTPLDWFKFQDWHVTVVEPTMPAVEVLMATPEWSIPQPQPNGEKNETPMSRKTFALREIFKSSELRDLLTPYEKAEIPQYQGHVYFLGQSRAVKVNALPPTTAAASRRNAPQPADASLAPPTEELRNFGYDDEQQMYIVKIGDHVAYRYELLGELGSGSFGKVMKALDHKTGQYVAVKIIKNEEKFHRQAMVEIRILDMLRRQGPATTTCCIEMLDHFKFRTHTCIVFSLCGMNLYELQKSYSYRGFTLDEIRVFCKSILTAMNTMWKLKLIHCDIKPENILLVDNEKQLEGGLRLIDFGSGCREKEQIYTYIQSRFYRAPEIMLGLPYDRRIDMWSFGCCVCEMALGYPIFPGENEYDQMSRIFEVIPFDVDSSAGDLFMNAPKRSKFFHSDMRPRRYAPEPRKNGGFPLKHLMKAYAKITDSTFLDFLNEFLQLDPELRAPPDEALIHPFLTGADYSSTGSAGNVGDSGDHDPDDYDDDDFDA
jgi:dual specificity tyrosine-phosphorylation-regulated kinase 2/3/4